MKGTEIRCWQCRKKFGVFVILVGVIICPRCGAENEIDHREAA